MNITIPFEPTAEQTRRRESLSLTITDGATNGELCLCIKEAIGGLPSLITYRFISQENAIVMRDALNEAFPNKVDLSKIEAGDQVTFLATATVFGRDASAYASAYASVHIDIESIGEWPRHERIVGHTPAAPAKPKPVLTVGKKAHVRNTSGADVTVEMLGGDQVVVRHLCGRLQILEVANLEPIE